MTDALPRVRCAICERPVERLVWERSPSEFGVSLTAYCHGDEDRMRVEDSFLARLSKEEADELFSSEGVAFLAKRIEADLKGFVGQPNTPETREAMARAIEMIGGGDG